MILISFFLSFFKIVFNVRKISFSTSHVCFPCNVGTAPSLPTHQGIIQCTKVFLMVTKARPYLPDICSARTQKLPQITDPPPLSVIVSICLTPLPPSLVIVSICLNPLPPFVSDCRHFSNPPPPFGCWHSLWTFPYPLHCSSVQCKAMQCTELHCNALHCTLLHCNGPYCTPQHHITLYCTPLQFTLPEKQQKKYVGHCFTLLPPFVLLHIWTKWPFDFKTHHCVTLSSVYGTRIQAVQWITVQCITTRPTPQPKAEQWKIFPLHEIWPHCS